MINEPDNSGGKQQGQDSPYPEGQADYGSPRGSDEDGASPGTDGDQDEGMSKEEWLRRNPDGGFDPEPAPGEGMSKEEYLRQNQVDDAGGKGGGRY